MNDSVSHISSMDEVMSAMNALTYFNFGLAQDSTGHMLTGYEEHTHSVDELTYYLTPDLHQLINPLFTEDVYDFWDTDTRATLYDALQKLQTIENRKQK
ncbi:hypothetical protein [Hymenobacter sp. APR13]|uniref:hypothetical protein n=1 Tax=Hymenobacter sp. APR13 TaxID=1356852 RepID=UPI0004E06C6F|nr:hypothetical protein [Hymenobacter sp. APR13]AII50384.1 hypothetical protein N008_00090 [Hymenobacter sp. APR13]